MAFKGGWIVWVEWHPKGPKGEGGYCGSNGTIWYQMRTKSWVDTDANGRLDTQSGARWYLGILMNMGPSEQVDTQMDTHTCRIDTISTLPCEGGL